jgi:chemotaxis signal transduction protein
MSPTGLSQAAVEDRLAEVREAFDSSFTRPIRRHEADHAELLAIGAGGRAYALLLSQTSGVYPGRPVTPLPGPIPALLGVAGFAGAIVPVYDLAALLGHPGPDRPRWLVMAAGAPTLAFAFHDMDGHVRLPAASLITDSGERRHGCLRGMAPLAGGTRPIVDLPAARAAVHTLTGHLEERQT